MTCNLVNNEAQLRDAFDRVSGSQTGNEWAMFEYDGNSNIIKLGETGVGGLDELLASFSSAKIQFGFGTVAGLTPAGSSGTAQRKVLLVHWQGEAVPAARLATTASHLEEIRKFVRRVNVTIHARNEEDLDRESLAKKLEMVQEIGPNALGEKWSAKDSSSAAVASQPFVPPAPVGTLWDKASPQQDLDKVGREKFWTEMREEEEARRREDAGRRRQVQEEYARDQRNLADRLHKAHLDRQEGKGAERDKPPLHHLGASVDSAVGSKKGKLIAGRTQMFEQKAAELTQLEKPQKKPKTFKWQVIVQGKAAGQPVNQRTVPDPPPKQFEVQLKRKEPSGQSHMGAPQTESPEAPKPKVEQSQNSAVVPSFDEPIANNNTSQLPSAQVPADPKKEADEGAQEIHHSLGAGESPPPSEPTTISSEGLAPPDLANLSAENGDSGVKARALWDYQAEDSTEITFDPDDIISDIRMVHDGWWLGRAPNGNTGLFPSNYVQLIQ